MEKTIDYINKEIKGLKMTENKKRQAGEIRKKKVEARIFSLRNIASEALKDFIYNEYEGIG